MTYEVDWALIVGVSIYLSPTQGRGHCAINRLGTIVTLWGPGPTSSKRGNVTAADFTVRTCMQIHTTLGPFRHRPQSPLGTSPF